MNNIPLQYGDLLQIGDFFHTIINNKKRKMVVCLCNCGQYVCSRVDHIKSGKIMSCGCRFVKYNKSRQINISSDDLFELYITKDLTSKQISSLYNCSTTPIERKISKYNIKKERKSREKHPNWSGYKNITGSYWGQIIHGAKVRNLEFNITIEYIDSLYIKQNGRCALTDLVLSTDSKNHTASLDRIDSTKGYIKGNVQWLHKDINLIKINYQQEKFIELCNLVAKKNPL